MVDFYKLISETTTPLFRIMARSSNGGFSNNISCVHIGSGYILTVYHHLLDITTIDRINTSDFKKIIQNANLQEKALIEKYYIPAQGGLFYLLTFPQVANPTEAQNLQNEIMQLPPVFNKLGFDPSIKSYYDKGYLSPTLVIQLKEKGFYGSLGLHAKFESDGKYLNEVDNLNRHTYLIDLDLVQGFPEYDLAIYKMQNIGEDAIDKIPFIEACASLLNFGKSSPLYILQGSPNDFGLGHMLNNAEIEGIVDHFGIYQTPLGTHAGKSDGARYLSRNYFKFGSSGSPYISYVESEDKFYVSAIQSEACPIQMSINGDRSNNAQYTHALASPLFNIREALERLKLKLAA